MLRGLDLERLLLVEVAQLADRLLAIQRVVVEAHLGVEREHVVIARDDERIDLEQRRIRRDERVVHGTHEACGLGHGAPGESETVCQAPCLVGSQPQSWMNRLLEDQFRRLSRNGFDLDAALPTGHHDRPTRRTVEHEAEIELVDDVEPLLDERARDAPPGRPGLMCDQLHADDLGGQPLGFIGVGCQLDAAALASTARVNLRLDDDRATAQASRGIASLFRGERHFAFRHWHSTVSENRFGLVLVNLHGCPSWRDVTPLMM